ncbi:hypothetical protein E7Z59_08065 [Robertkochia marina]|uniref:Peptidase S33 tripeptidyl aminopeptidase-like C-terminal domain-containing protein n=1 Tax=Robertkochia marina TaxID=1227945 RepID=A0A4V3UY58_9FLAO|nr:alpha/beta hydrolase [Robertkochia marina]THD67606.1 hypothetical protein E7Z59_08065 [Robertkochia marina]TRZ44524.1 hypothetical protein D3A96_07875 [Robertkochia marina]
MKNCIFFLLFSISFHALSQQEITIEKKDCFLKDCQQFEDFPNVEFGHLTVPEDYNKPGGKYIQVAFSIIKSTAEHPEPDPILIFNGGWGLPDIHRTMIHMQMMPVKNRDIIVYDYRGSGYSTPNLCPDLGRQQWELVKQDLSPKEISDQHNKQLYSCFEELKEQGIDYRLYGTAVKTKDAVILMEQLGYEEVNLFGISNGTMGIQGFLRAAEDSKVTVRSVFSDSNVPMGDYMNGEGSLHYMDVLEKVLEACAGDPECEQAYPNLKERFYAFLEASMDNPLKVEGEEALMLNYYEINGAIHRLLYSASNFKDIPLVLEAFMAYELDFFEILLPRFKNIIEMVNGTSIINYTYDWKARQAKFTAEYNVVKKSNPEFTMLDMFEDFFMTDNTITYNPRDTIPVTSDVPALVVAGTHDPITPAKYSRVMHERYVNSFYFEYPNVGHGAFSTPCGRKMFKDFIESPSKRPEADCIAELKASPIEFTNSIYKNSKVNVLIREIALKQNALWICLLLFPFLLSLMFLFKELIGAIRRKGFQSVMFLTSFCILLFISGLAYYSFQTMQEGGLTLLFGLVPSAFWLPWVSLLILALTLYLIYEIFRTSKYSFWQTGVLLSSIVVLITALTFDIYPVL